MYNRDRESIELLQNHIVIELDFKQKIVTGMGPEQISYEYYRQMQFSCLGMFVLPNSIFFQPVPL